MSKALELVKLAREGNASRFGDVFVAGVQERVAAAIDAKRTTLTVKEEVQIEEAIKHEDVTVSKRDEKPGQDSYVVKHGDKVITTHPTEKGANKLADRYRKDGKL